MSVCQIDLGDSQIAVDHCQWRMPQQSLKGEHVASVLQVLDCQSVPESVGMDVLHSRASA
jgi:hypothetical protein